MEDPVNGVAVCYTDVDERQRMLWPNEHTELRIDDPGHPWNRQGLQVWASLDLTDRVLTMAGALSVGATWLAQRCWGCGGKL